MSYNTKRVIQTFSWKALNYSKTHLAQVQKKKRLHGTDQALNRTATRSNNLTLNSQIIMGLFFASILWVLQNIDWKSEVKIFKKASHMDEDIHVY